MNIDKSVNPFSGTVKKLFTYSSVQALMALLWDSEASLFISKPTYLFVKINNLFSSAKCNCSLQGKFTHGVFTDEILECRGV